MLSHLFPGLFLAITIFMLIDTWSSINLTAIVLKDINALVAFAGLLFIAGTILGVIIDAFHHDILEPYYFDRLDNQMGKLGIIQMKPRDSKEKCICYNDIIKYFEDLNCGRKNLFIWEDIIEKIEKKDTSIKELKEILAQILCKEWIKCGIAKSNDKKDKICISYGDNKIELNLYSKQLTITENIKGNNKFLKLLDVDPKDNKKIIYEHECKLKDDCKFHFPKNFSPTKIYYFFRIKEGELDDHIAIYEHLRRSIFHYYEFYINTFTSLIPFTLIAPMYIHNELGINNQHSLGIAIALSLLTYSCLHFSYMSRKRYISALYFAYCACRRQYVPE